MKRISKQLRLLFVARRCTNLILNDPINYDAVIASHGGCGTTMLLEFLAKQCYTVNRPYLCPKPYHCLKHAGAPLAGRVHSARFIYLFSNPLAAVRSLYHRAYAFEHAVYMHAGLRRLFYPAVAKTLKGYAEQGKDTLLIERHFNSWYQARLSKPVLLLRYETLWDNLGVLFDFLELPAAARNHFPKCRQRTSITATLPPEVTAGLNRIYGKFVEKLEMLPDYIIMPPPPPPPPPSSLMQQMKINSIQ